MVVQSFKHQTPAEIIFGNGEIWQLLSIIDRFGYNILLVTGRKSIENSSSVQNVIRQLKTKCKIQTELITNEPSPEQINSIVKQYKNELPDVVISIGGGSVIDAGKAISAMLKADHSIENYLEGVGAMQPNGDKVPFVAISTTAGTGSECTKNAVITKLGIDGYKKSLRHDNYLPDIALVDPELTMSCSPLQTAASGLDATTQLLEAYLSVKQTAMINVLAVDALVRILTNIEIAVFEGSLEARTEVSYASMLSGVVIANAGIGLVHGFAQPLGSIVGIPHGIVCANLIGIVNKITVDKLRMANDSEFLIRYQNLATVLYPEFEKGQAIDLLIERLLALPRLFNLPRFREFGLIEENFSLILKLTSHKNHPIKFSKDELIQVLLHSL